MTSKHLTCHACLTALWLATVSAAPGDLDLTFGGNGLATIPSANYTRAIATQPDGKIVVACDGMVVRYGTDGQLDASFSGDGILEIPDGYAIVTLAMQADKRILIGASARSSSDPYSDYAVIRVMPNGQLDSSFSGDGIVVTNIRSDRDATDDIKKLLVQADGKILAWGQSESRPGIVRYLPNGDLDASFGTGGVLNLEIANITFNTINDAILQPDQKVLICGPSNNGFGVVRLNPNWSVDSSFSMRSYGTAMGPIQFSVPASPSSIELQPDGKIVVTGTVSQPRPGWPTVPYDDIGVARLLANGQSDLSFSGDGNQIILSASLSPGVFGSYQVPAAVIRPDGKLLIGGCYPQAVGPRWILARLNADGTFDASFSDDGTLFAAPDSLLKRPIIDLIQQPNGRVLAAISTDLASVARFLIDPDTDGDGADDVVESAIGTVVTDPDTDDDGLNDGDELARFFTDPKAPDSDNDGLLDAAEALIHSSDPNDTDSDDDGLGDQAEVVIHGTNPTRGDTDSDGLSDFDEINTHSTNPLNSDMDDDGLKDGVEILTTRSSPTNPDTDGDGINDGDEKILGTNLLEPDTDGDGINDGAEVQQGRSPLIAEPVVTNLVAEQRTGTKFFDISYDLASTTPTVKMTLEISSDGGVTYTVPVTSATGAIGEGVAVGNGKSIVWNAGADWNAKSSSQMRFRLIADNQIIDGLSVIPAGSFTMGRTSGDTDSNAPPVIVNVSRFYMGKYEVTKALWDDIRTWAVANGYTDIAAGAGKAADHPVQTVSWWDVVKWCNARSEKEGFTPCYTVSGVVMKTGNSEPTVNWSANGYRLPTDAEWEKAARGGVSGKRFPWGTDTISHSQANYRASTSYIYDSSGSVNSYHPTYNDGTTPFTSPVGTFAANGYGLNDMAGNVCEWCWNWYEASSYVNGETDPRGAASGTNRVYRGCSWDDYAIYCRAASRSLNPPWYKYYGIGFRIARDSGVGAIASFSSTDANLDTRMWTLTTSPVVNGSVSGAGSHLSQTSANLTATPSPGYLLGSWSGAASGSTNPLTILMDSDKTVGATFVEDTRDADNDGLTNYQEIITYGTNPELADTDGDSIGDGAEIDQGRSPLVSEPVVSNLTATQRQGIKLVDITYDVAADTPTVKVTLEISSDGGATWAVPANSATGAVGDEVTVGTSKTILWNAGEDWDGRFTPQTRFRVVADDRQIPGFTEVEAGNLPASSWAGAQSVASFYMAKTEVTWSEFANVRTWAAVNGYDIGNVGAGTEPNHPVTNTTWYQTLKWCNARSEKEGLSPVYKVGSGIYRTGDSVPTVDATANGYRLPSEKEWEFAARGGLKTTGYEFSGSNNINTVAWFNENSSQSIHEVGTKQANELGLSDMSGNVWEWCYDNWNGWASFRVYRGGSWSTIIDGCLIANRAYYYPTLSLNNVGFRIAITSITSGAVGNATTNTSLDTRDWNLVVTNSIEGTASGAGSYLSGTNAILTASPSTGYLFGSWYGDASGNSNPRNLIMDADKTVGATFVEDTRDPDSDGLSNYQEIIIQLTNPNLADTDGDGVNDGQEVTDGTNPKVTDSDADGLSDGDEKTRGTNPLLADSDGDSYSDSYEIQFSSDPKLASSFPTYLLTLVSNGAATGGSFSKSGSLAHGTNATLTATPSSGYLFGSWSGNATGSSNPLTLLMNANKTVGATFVEDTNDPDNDGLTNYQEIIVRLTNPNVADTDGDDVNDGQEVSDGTNPKVTDSDGDGLSDGDEKTRDTNPLVADTDGDSYDDGYEVQNSSDPKSNTSFPTYTLTLTTNGTATGGIFSKSGTLAHGTNATLTATPSSGYLFGSWSGNATGSSNPLTLLMNANKTVGATFVGDTNDPDNDGLTNYQEIIVRFTNPNVADTDGDGVTDGQEVTDGSNPKVTDSDGDGLSDGEEKYRGTNPLSGDSDGDGLGDLQEELLTKTDPLKQDSDGNGIIDSFEDPDNDGILNGREVNERATDPKKADSDGDGLSDTYELIFKGSTDAFKPRIGDRIRLDMRELGFQGSFKLIGKLPVGMTFNATTGILEGKLTGKPLTSALTIQILNGKTVVRSIPLSLPVGAFPFSISGGWQALLEDTNGQPQGLLSATLSSPGTYTATLDVAGSKVIRSIKGSFELEPGVERASISMTFQAATGLAAQTLTLRVSGVDALASGTHAQGTIRGFRLARGSELPRSVKSFTLVIDQGVQDGFQIPAGMGWATGTISTTGIITMSGQLGDAKSLTGSFKLGATGQALLWLKPYLNLSSRLGGVVSFHGSGGVPITALARTDQSLWWYRVADARELSYPSGFASLLTTVGVRPFTPPVNATALATTLGLTQQTFKNVIFDGGGLPDPDAAQALPNAFALDAAYKLITVPMPGRLMAPWQGSINAKTGSFSSTLGVTASTSGILAGNAAVSGVLFPTVDVEGEVGAGLVRIPIAGPAGSFRTGAVVLSNK